MDTFKNKVVDIRRLGNSERETLFDQLGVDQWRLVAVIRNRTAYFIQTIPPAGTGPDPD